MSIVRSFIHALALVGLMVGTEGCESVPLPLPDLAMEDLAGRDFLPPPPDLKKSCSASLTFQNRGDVMVEKGDEQSPLVFWTFHLDQDCPPLRRLTDLEFVVTTDVVMKSFDVHMECYDHEFTRKSPIPGGYHLVVPLDKRACDVTDRETGNILIMSDDIRKGRSSAVITLKRLRTCDALGTECVEVQELPSTETVFIR